MGIVSAEDYVVPLLPPIDKSDPFECPAKFLA
jgi:hypothetical protein